MEKSKEELIRKALFIRRFEEKLLDLFSKGELHGTIHTCVGQEWTGVAAAGALSPGDTIFSNHRCHGHFLAWTDDPAGLLAEIMGKAEGVCKGIGGSQHVHAAGFYANGIQGGMVPVSAGKALAEKLDRSGKICLVFIGDGTLGEGVLYETLNIACKWRIPLLIAVENNGIAQSTQQKQSLAGSIEARAKAFAVRYLKSSTWEWEDLLEDFKYAAGYVREHSAPFLLEIETYRLKPHSKGDDTREKGEVEYYASIDPLNKILEKDPALANKLKVEIDGLMSRIIKEAGTSAWSELNTKKAEPAEDIRWQKMDFERERVSDLIYKTLRKNMEGDPRIILIGEDVEAPYGGAFKITRDLSRLFPGRVRNTPISEAAITGIATGLALGGYRPVVEIMFGDFLTLCFDQLLNHACKFRFMYGKDVLVPVIVRTPMGGNRGYGPTHSQSLEKHFLGIPDLEIIALNARMSPERIYDRLFTSSKGPVLVVENKVLYTKFLRDRPISGFECAFSNEEFPTLRISPAGHDPDVTLFCYGGVLEVVEEAVEIAFDEFDVICEVICPSRIHPLDVRPLLVSLARTRRLVTVEEGPTFAALGAEAVAGALEKGAVIERIRRIGCDSFIPCSRELERQVLPGVNDVVLALKEVVHDRVRS